MRIARTAAEILQRQADRGQLIELNNRTTCQLLMPTADAADLVIRRGGQPPESTASWRR
jgi:hypothetical protein